MSKKSGLSFLWLSAVAFVVDLLTKYIVVQKFDLYESVNVLPVFNLTYVRNYGAAFSFLADHSGWQQYFFILLALAISGMLVYFLAKNNAEQKIQNSAYALIIGGALANMVDRACNGFVVDFFHPEKQEIKVFDWKKVVNVKELADDPAKLPEAFQ